MLKNFSRKSVLLILTLILVSFFSAFTIPNTYASSTQIVSATDLFNAFRAYVVEVPVVNPPSVPITLPAPTTPPPISISSPVNLVASPIVSDSYILSILRRLISEPDIQNELRGPQGIAGPAGSSGSSSGISANQLDGIYRSIENKSEALAEKFTTKELNVNGDINIAGTSQFTGHMALGNAATIDNAFDFGSDIINIADNRSGDISYNSSGYQQDLTVLSTYSNSSSSAALIYSLDIEPSISADSTGPIDGLSAGYFGPANHGQGVVNSITGVDVAPSNDSASVDRMYGIDVNGLNNGTGNINNGYAIFIGSPSNSGTVNNNYGLYVDDQSGITTTNDNFNIYSAGANSRNFFTGNLEVDAGIDSNTKISTLNGDDTSFYASNENDSLSLQSQITAINSSLNFDLGSQTTNAYSIRSAGVFNDTASADNYYGFWNRIVGDPGSHITNSYGIYLQAPDTINIDNNYALVTEPGAGNVGIGTTTPGSVLQVNGGAAIGYNSSQAAPTNGLIVSGHTTFEGVTSTGATGTGNFVFDASPTLITPNLGTPSTLVGTNISGTASSLSIGGSAPAGSLTGTTLASNVVSSSLTSVGTLSSGLIVGTATTGGQGTFTFHPNAFQSGPTGSDYFLNLNGTFSSTALGSGAINTGINISVASAGSGSFATSTLQGTVIALTSGYTGGGTSKALAITNSAAGTGTFAAIGTTANYGITVTDSSTTSGNNAGGYFSASGSSSKNIGLISRAISSGNSAALNVGVYGGANAATTNVGGYFGLNSTASTPTLSTSSALIADNSTQAADIFEARDNGTIKLKIVDGGNLAVGNNTPENPLEVTGAACFDTATDTNCTTAGTAGDIYYGTAHANWTDIAEKYPSTSILEAGDVVMIDTDAIEGNSIFKPYITLADGTNTTLGIISTHPGMTLGDDYGKSEDYSLTLAGRVPVNFSNENGEVLPGDHLTLSLTKPGLAMKQTSSGNSIGIALQSSTNNTQVLTLVNLNYQQLNLSLTDASVELTPNSGFVSSLISWLGDVGNGIAKIFVGEVHTQEICVKKSDGNEVCINGDQLDTILQNENITPQTPPPSDSGSDTTPPPDSGDTTPPPAEDSTPPDETVTPPAGGATPPDTTSPPVSDPAPDAIQTQ